MSEAKPYGLLYSLHGFLLLLCAAILTYACIAPQWISDVNGGSFGVTGFCDDRKDFSTCHRYHSIQSDTKRGAVATTFFGILLMWFSFIISIVSCCCCHASVGLHRFIIVTACLFILLGVLFFVGGLDEEKDVCPKARSFFKGDCTFGHVFLLVIIFDVVALVVSFFVTRPLYQEQELEFAKQQREHHHPHHDYDPHHGRIYLQETQIDAHIPKQAFA
eukprot:m.137529 g.137529  ORF g.137529 m.137529 type:complete len:218 (+) comp11889_c0_seq1:62-715(+)